MLYAAKKGFTLIELLIVIVIIGILAVAVLSAINPIEQINKAEDARVRSDSNELLNAYERYYTTHGEYPWDADTNATTPAGPIIITNCSLNNDEYTCDTDNAYVSDLVNSGELKPEFLDRATFQDGADPSLNIYVDTTEQLVKLCFDPSSKAYSDSATYSLDASTYKPTKADCSNNPNCYLCVPE